MSSRLALVLFVGIVIAEVALRVSQAIDRAVELICPCEGGHR